MTTAHRETVATHHYFDREFGISAVKLLPGEYFVTASDMVLTTVLGSCVSACVRDTTAGIGGMNHFMLPEDADPSSRGAAASMRYGAYAMEMLLNELFKAGARRERLEAKVFGGGAVLANMTLLNIGERNADFVLRYLQMSRCVWPPRTCAATTRAASTTSRRAARSPCASCASRTTWRWCATRSRRWPPT
jgi:chemotaxis protein CheD